MSQSGTDNEEARVFAFERMPFGTADEGRFMVVGLSQPLAVQGDVLHWGAPSSSSCSCSAWWA